MRLWPRTLRARIAVALTLAAVAVLGLDRAVRWFDEGPAAPRRLGASFAGAATASPSAPAVGPVVPPAPAPPPRSLGFRLRPTAGTIVLAQRLASLPPDLAPVVEILGDGQLVLRRPSPLASGPAGEPRCSRDGHGAAVVLPDGGLAALSPDARGALVGLLEQWIVERPVVAARRIRLADFDVPIDAVQRLLAWLP